MYDRRVTISRLLVLIFSLSIPIYFGILVSFVEFYTFGRGEVAASLLDVFVSVLILSFPWLLFLYLNRDRVAYSFMMMWEVSGLIPFKWRIFYGFNAALFSLFFFFPLVSPFVSLISFILISGRIVSKILGRSLEERTTLAWVLFITISIALTTPTFLYLWRLIPNLFNIIDVLTEFWYSLFPYTSLVSLWIADSISIGDLVEVLYHMKIEREIMTYGLKRSDIPYGKIRIFEASLFFLYFVIWFFIPLDRTRVFETINTICLASMVLSLTLMMVKGIRVSERKINFLSIAIASFFVGIYTFEQVNPEALSLIFVLSFILFSALFVYCFRKVETQTVS
ncbi:MAG: hypothetical protein J7L50_02845 [Candidatus Odinarchaeota archaeon]|nr:hypothetical protein [Candidatus Odinarchaeota archaeon]